MPSRNTASGLTPSMVWNSLADLPIRWVNITSWPAAEISAAGAFCCSLSDDTVSAISSRSDDWRLMVRRASTTCVRIFCWPITTLALRSARSIRGLTASRSGLKGSPSACTPSSLSPEFRARTLRANTPELSATSWKACGLPTSACDTDLARRCDCISAWPVAASCCAVRSACCSTQPAISASTTTPTASKASNRR